jgi:hypothetical protein
MKSPSTIAARGGSLFVVLSTALCCQPSYAASYSGSGTVATMDIADFTTFGANPRSRSSDPNNAPGYCYKCGIDPSTARGKSIYALFLSYTL